MSVRPYLIRTLLSIAMFISSCVTLVAQESTQSASIHLEVADESGGVIAGAEVQILSLSNGHEDNLRTDSDGKLFLKVTAGGYDLRVESRGFRAAKQHVKAEPGTNQKIAVVLKVGSCPPDCQYFMDNDIPLLSANNGPLLPANDVFPLSFPEQLHAVSPDERYVIVGIERITPPYHTAFLEDRVLKTRRKLFSYDRRVALLWSPNSKLFAVTDYVGSNSSRCMIFSTQKKAPPIQVQDLLFNALAEMEQKNLKTFLSNHHGYLEAAMWMGSIDLRLNVSGYSVAAPTGFTNNYVVHVPFGQP